MPVINTAILGALSIKFNTCLTLSMPSNSLPPNPLHIRLRAQLDTFSVYRGPWCEQVPAQEARAQQLSIDPANGKYTKNHIMRLEKLPVYLIK